MIFEDHVHGSFWHIIRADMKSCVSEDEIVAQILKAKVSKQKKFRLQHWKTPK